MPDWLTHVLVGYALATALSARYDWIDSSFVTLAMVGALVPDLEKASLLLPSDVVAAALGVPFDWSAFHTLGGSLVVVCALALCLPDAHRGAGLLVLSLGAGSHHVLDVLLTQSGGATYPFLWPVIEYRAPSVDLFRSSDRELAAVATLFAVAVWYVRYQVLPTAPPSVADERRSGQ